MGGIGACAFVVAPDTVACSLESSGGFFLIEAADFDEALKIAEEWPSAQLGTIEVRPLEEELRTERRY